MSLEQVRLRDVLRTLPDVAELLHAMQLDRSVLHNVVLGHGVCSAPARSQCGLEVLSLRLWRGSEADAGTGGWAKWAQGDENAARLWSVTEEMLGETFEI